MFSTNKNNRSFTVVLGKDPLTPEAFLVSLNRLQSDIEATWSRMRIGGRGILDITKLYQNWPLRR
jgi:hypothetical protein